MKVVIDGRFVADEQDLHRRLAGAFGYPPSYSPALSTLRDRLAAGDPRPVQLTLIHAAALRLTLGCAAYERFLAVLAETETRDEGKSWAERFVLRLFE